MEFNYQRDNGVSGDYILPLYNILMIFAKRVITSIDKLDLPDEGSGTLLHFSQLRRNATVTYTCPLQSHTPLPDRSGLSIMIQLPGTRKLSERGIHCSLSYSSLSRLRNSGAKESFVRRGGSQREIVKMIAFPVQDIQPRGTIQSFIPSYNSRCGPGGQVYFHGGFDKPDV